MRIDCEMEILNKFPVVPVLVIDDASWAGELGACLVDAGMPLVEVTLRTAQSWRAVAAMRTVAGLTVGLGSVTKTSDLIKGKELGVDFAVSAGLSEDLIMYARNEGIPYLPGVATPSELLRSTQLGVEIVKWFPAETLGGIPALKAISAPFPSLRFVPTGGINIMNANTYLQEKNVIAVGGSWMFDRDSMSNKDVAKIAWNIKKAVEMMEAS